jgi:hypothetical protein
VSLGTVLLVGEASAGGGGLRKGPAGDHLFDRLALAVRGRAVLKGFAAGAVTFGTHGACLLPNLPLIRGG